MVETYHDEATHIERLPENIVNRIAAGEVISRPAAVVKELAENALDSGADKVTIALNGGGIDRIIVSDNGRGMSASDLKLAVQRHCTSKIEDRSLVHISTFGFRGEALPSIGAVARLGITTRAENDPNGWHIQVDGGRVHPVTPSSAKRGTKVDVQSLFYATPARRKFLKSPKVEARHVEAIVKKLALSAPKIAFTFENDGRTVFSLPPQPEKKRVETLIKTKDSGEMLEIDATGEDMRLLGFAYPPSVNRANNTGQYMMVNGRPVNDPILRIAIRVAYRGLIEAGRHPIVAIMLEVPQEDVDVNVHPAKTEVRFAHEGKVRNFVISAIRRTLSHGAGIAGMKPNLGHIQTSQPLAHRTPPTTTSGGAAMRLNLQQAPSMRKMQGQELAFEKASLTQAPQESRPEPSQPTQVISTPDEQTQDKDYPLGAVITQILNTYILSLASDGSLILIDQHAAHERVTHELLRRQYLEGKMAEQRLLIPEVVDVSAWEKEILLRQQKALQELGIVIEDFGHDALLVRALPALLDSSDGVGILKDVAQELGEDTYGTPSQTHALGDRFDHIIATMACHGSIRAGRRMKKEEMDSLLRTMERMPRTGTCSHGRPTWIKLCKTDIEKLFGRH